MLLGGKCILLDKDDGFSLPILLSQNKYSKELKAMYYLYCAL